MVFRHHAKTRVSADFKAVVDKKVVMENFVDNDHGM